MYRRSSVSDIELSNPGFVGVAEMLWRLERKGGKIVEVPAVLDVRQFGQSKMRVLEVTMAHLRLLAEMMSVRPFPITDRMVRPNADETTTNDEQVASQTGHDESRLVEESR